MGMSIDLMEVLFCFDQCHDHPPVTLVSMHPVFDLMNMLVYLAVEAFNTVGGGKTTGQLLMQAQPLHSKGLFQPFEHTVGGPHIAHLQLCCQLLEGCFGSGIIRMTVGLLQGFSHRLLLAFSEIS